MAGLQDIINQAGSIEINRRKVVGIQITRNEIPRTSLTPTRNPWRFTIDMPPVLSWNAARSLVEYLDNLDRYSPQEINFNNSCISFIFRYQGQLSTGQLALFTVQSFTGNTLVLTGLPTVSPTVIMFEPNDLIQIGANPYPFTVVNQVVRGSTGTVTLTTNRPNFFTTSVVGAGLTVGSGCTFNLFCPNMPTYKLVPGNYALNNTTGAVLNKARVEFSDVFELYEFVGSAA